jgi:serine/threonine protein kinase
VPSKSPTGGGKAYRAFRSQIEGRFELLEELGAGGMGKVVRGRDRVTNRPVAIKTPHGQGLAPNQLDRFLREGEIMASLDHPGIVAVLGFGKTERRPYLVCELVEDAKTLDQLTALPLRRQDEILRDVARAVGYAHERGITHRDLKPDNVLVDGSGRTRVTDFGLALDTGLDRLTKTGMNMGTPGYMPPELFRDAKATGPFTDTWAIGAMLYRVVSGGRPPFPAASLIDLAKRVREKPDPLPEAPTALARIVKRALNADPQLRYPDGEALARDLDAYLEGEVQKSRGRAFVVVAVIVALLGAQIVTLLAL